MPCLALAIALTLSLTACLSGNPSITVRNKTGCPDSVRINVNDSFSLKMRVTISTGFRWECQDSTDLLKLMVNNPPAIIPDNPNEDGGYGYQLFTWKAVKKGTLLLRLKYRRIFGGPTKFDDSCHVYVAVY